MARDDIPDILIPADRPSLASGCPVPWEAWFAELSTWVNAASSPRWGMDGQIRMVAVGGMIHVHAVLDWDGKSEVDVGQPCAMDSAFMVSNGSMWGHGWMGKGESGIIVTGLQAGRIVIDGWFPAELGDDK